jgi:hypothetical protein
LAAEDRAVKRRQANDLRERRARAAALEQELAEISPAALLDLILNLPLPALVSWIHNAPHQAAALQASLQALADTRGTLPLSELMALLEQQERVVGFRERFSTFTAAFRTLQTDETLTEAERRQRIISERQQLQQFVITAFIPPGNP